jgi:hypothetical protein
MIHKLMRPAFLAIALALAGLAPSPAPASAQTTRMTVGCYGDYCSGQDPEQSGCSADARTIVRTGVYGTGGTQWVEIRWSDTCKTNWARTNVLGTTLQAVQQTGYTQGYSNNNGTYAWTKMIYSPVLCVKGSISHPPYFPYTVTPCV